LKKLNNKNKQIKIKIFLSKIFRIFNLENHSQISKNSQNNKNNNHQVLIVLEILIILIFQNKMSHKIFKIKINKNSKKKTMIFQQIFVFEIFFNYQMCILKFFLLIYHYYHF